VAMTGARDQLVRHIRHPSAARCDRELGSPPDRNSCVCARAGTFFAGPNRTTAAPLQRPWEEFRPVRFMVRSVHEPLRRLMRDFR
jgi:hypothetical protein